MKISHFKKLLDFRTYGAKLAWAVVALFFISILDQWVTEKTIFIVSNVKDARRLGLNGKTALEKLRHDLLHLSGEKSLHQKDSKPVYEGFNQRIAEVDESYQLLLEGEVLEALSYSEKVHTSLHKSFQAWNQTVKPKINVLFEHHKNNRKDKFQKLHSEVDELLDQFIYSIEQLFSLSLKELPRLMRFHANLQFGFFVVLSIFVLLVLWVSLSMSRRAQKIAETAREITKGRENLRLPEGGNDELASVSKSFNYMVDWLKRTSGSKEYLKFILNSIEDMFFVFDEQGRLMTTNVAAFKKLGYSKEEMTSELILEIFEGGYFSNMSMLFAIAQEEGLNEFESTCLTKEKVSIPVLITTKLLTNERGVSAGLILVAKDARESRLLQDLQTKQAQLVQSAKLASLGEMSSGVAHELNNPLFVIKGFNQRIQAAFKKSESVQYDKVESYIKYVNDAADRMVNIIRHMREFARQSDPKLEPISLNEVIKKSFILLQEQLRLRSIKIELDLSQEDPMILADANRLEQVFVNLISNSRDAHEEKDSRDKWLKVTSKVEGELVVIEFEDNGPGIKRVNQDKIFDPFFTTKEVGKGTGLGLSISHGIIKTHKGEISCQSALGKGVCFHIYLPLAKENLLAKVA